MLPQRAVTATLGIALIAGCSFGATLAPDARPSDDADIDAPMDVPPEDGRAIVALTRDGAPVVAVVPFDGTGFGTACTEVAAGDPYKALARHPQLPYVYGVESRLAGIGIDCAAPQVTNLSEAGGVRAPMQDIVVDPAAMVGFFTTVPDTGSMSVHRFTLDANGVPSVGGSTRGPTLSGPIVLDASAGELFVGGASVVFRIALVGASLTLPTTFTHAGACRVVGLALRPSRLLAFCSDTDQVRRYTRAPFALIDQSPGPIGAVDRVLAINPDLVVAARISPPGIVVVGLANDQITVKDSVELPSRVLGMALSLDKRTLLVTRQADASMTELRSFEIGLDASLAPVGSTMMLGTATAVTALR